jgi:hypothetical protein
MLMVRAIPNTVVVLLGEKGLVGRKMMRIAMNEMNSIE